MTPKLHFRRLRVEPYDPKALLPGLHEDGDEWDTTSFSRHRYIVTFEYRIGWRRKWRKVKEYA